MFCFDLERHRMTLNTHSGQGVQRLTENADRSDSDGRTLL